MQKQHTQNKIEVLSEMIIWGKTVMQVPLLCSENGIGTEILGKLFNSFEVECKNVNVFLSCDSVVGRTTPLCPLREIHILISRTCKDVRAWGKGELKFAGGIKFADQLILR